MRRAFDGIKYGGSSAYAAAAITAAGINPYLQLDLGTPVSGILGVSITADFDCCPERMQDLSVWLSNDGPSFATSGVRCGLGGLGVRGIGEELVVSCDAQGRAADYQFVTVQRVAAGYLAALEVEVLRLVDPCPPAPPPPPPAPPKPKVCGDGFVFISVDDADDGGHADNGQQGGLYPAVMLVRGMVYFAVLGLCWGWVASAFGSA